MTIEFISEAITPRRGSSDAAAMGRGEPGLPTAFRWRGRWYEVAESLQQWKQSQPEGGKAGGELYLRRHYYKLAMADGATWTVYFVRQPPRGGPATNRWFLYTIEAGKL